MIKKDGSRINFDRNKILSGLLKACEKRPVSTEILETIVSEIESVIYDKFEREVETTSIGELVMQHLRVLDKVAYVRFASVYREFKDINEFINELTPLMHSTKKTNRIKQVRMEGNNTMAVETIQKRNSRMMAFDESKIADAIFKAAKAVGGADRSIAAELASVVTHFLQKRI